MNANVMTRTEQSHLLCDECGSEFFKKCIANAKSLPKLFAFTVWA